MCHLEQGSKEVHEENIPTRCNGRYPEVLVDQTAGFLGGVWDFQRRFGSVIAQSTDKEDQNVVQNHQSPPGMSWEKQTIHEEVVQNRISIL